MMLSSSTFFLLIHVRLMPPVLTIDKGRPYAAHHSYNGLMLDGCFDGAGYQEGDRFARLSPYRKTVERRPWHLLESKQLGELSFQLLLSGQKGIEVVRRVEC
jgi:hypothetical protein